MTQDERDVLEQIVLDVESCASISGPEGGNLELLYERMLANVVAVRDILAKEA